MWLSSRAVRIAGLLLGLVGPLALAGCTGLTPVYGDNGLGAQRVQIAYNAPANRLERIIYNDLSLRLGSDQGGSEARLSVSASQRSTALTNDTVSAAALQRQMIVTAAVTLVRPDGKMLFSGTLSQTADYTIGAQAFANQEAAANAAENAARLLADTIRLKVLAALLK